jgi:hypothetical protein
MTFPIKTIIENGFYIKSRTFKIAIICLILLLPTLIPLSGVGITCFHHVVIKM